ncbi:MAG: hypothetical protein DWI02_04060 [Planctomycetota bacterium]|nr:MAG: hypothetical protein DWI02_04060 [Planctomycetota bacterium]
MEEFGLVATDQAGVISIFRKFGKVKIQDRASVHLRSTDCGLARCGPQAVQGTSMQYATRLGEELSILCHPSRSGLQIGDT